MGWSGNGQTDDFWHACVIAEEVLRSSGGDVTAGHGGVERVEARPFLDDVDQIRRGGIGEGVGHLLDDVVGFDQANNRGRFRGPEVLEAAEVCVLAAGEQAVEMLGEDREIAVWVVDACTLVTTVSVGGGSR
jgi:hypothetical protein